MWGHIFAVFLLFLSVTVHAAPESGHHSGHDHHCISDQEAVDLIHTWFTFYQQGFDPKAAEETLTDDFQTFSASLNFIHAQNFDVVVGKAEFIETQKVQSAQTTEVFSLLESKHTCDTVFFRWTDNSTPVPLFGIDWFEVVKGHKGKWQIRKDYGEFNNAAALFNAKLFPCPG